jgi:hypothetical protein
MKEYENQLMDIWEKTHPILGQITLIALIKKIVKKQETEYPLLAKIKIDSKGFDFEEFRKLASSGKEDGSKSLEALHKNLHNLICQLTGNIILR